MGGPGSGARSKRLFTPDPDRDVWERQDGESDPAWQAFSAYRDLGLGRTADKVAKAFKKSNTLMEGWSVRWSWRKRVEAWDAELDRQRRDASIQAEREASRDMVSRHLDISEAIQRLTSVELARWLHKIGADDYAELDLEAEPELSAEEIRKLIDYGIKLERLNRGEPEAITETHTKSDDDVSKGLSKLTNDELLTFRKLKQKMETS